VPLKVALGAAAGDARELSVPVATADMLPALD
jgi:hypothetical protein